MIVKDTSHANPSYTLQAKLRPIIEQLCDDNILSRFSENYHWSTQELSYEFDFYCETHDGIPLDIECDYSGHHTYEKDMERDALVSDNGIYTIRVSERKIYRNRAATFIKHEINRIRNSEKTETEKESHIFPKTQKISGPISGLCAAVSTNAKYNKYAASACLINLAYSSTRFSDFIPSHGQSETFTLTLTLPDEETSLMDKEKFLELFLPIASFKLLKTKTNNPENLVIFINKDLPGLTRKSSFRHHDGFICDTNVNDRIKHRWSIFTEATPLFCSLANVPIKTARRVTDTITRSNDYSISLDDAYRITDVINSLLIEAKNLVASPSKTYKVDSDYDELSWHIDSMDSFEAIFHRYFYQIIAEFPDKLNSSQSYISVATLFDIISRFNFTFEQPKSIEDINRFLVEKHYVYEKPYAQQKTGSSLFIAPKTKEANLLKLGWYFIDKPLGGTKPSRCEICVGGTVLQEIYDYFGLFK